MTRAADIRIGVSGWTYTPWRGSFYPKGLPQKSELNFAASIFSSVEINGTFYSLQSPSSFGKWAEAVPEDFVFAVKGPRYITHMLRLNHCEAALANFLASGVLRLGPKLGPILWQFPPNFRFEPETLEAFLRLLPYDTEAASARARHHNDKLKTPAWIKPEAHQKIRHAVEIRHDSFRDPAFIDLLRAYDVALVCADTVEWPRLMDLTSDFVYVRLHGSEDLYRSGYSDKALAEWAARVRAWSHGKPMHDGDFVSHKRIKAKPRDVFFFFDNTDKLHAPDDAQTLMRKLGLEGVREGASRAA